MVGTQAIFACVILLAALVVRSAVNEMKRPGSARQEWQFLTNRPAPVGGGLAFAALAAAVVLSGSAWGNVAWAVLAGLLTAFIIDQMTSRDHEDR
ncbi:hypothetical protein ACFT7U_35500 [Streptomyces rochei]|uniref:hypothetical protein n=1 Tax=Streptomyces rochei TaxID=1928 RepID=UPI00363CBC7A